MQSIQWKWLERIHLLDERMFLAVNRHPRHCDITCLARIASRSADGWLYAALPALMTWRNPDTAWLFTGTLMLAFVLERSLYLALKQGLKRNRPAQAIPGYCSVITAADEFSFPSGHTSGAFLVSTVLCLIYGGALLPLYGWAAAVGLSRVVLGVHFPTDILAGATMGCSIALLTCALLL